MTDQESSEIIIVILSVIIAYLIYNHHQEKKKKCIETFDWKKGELETPAEAIFAHVDQDSSGAISFEEFASWWARRAADVAEAHRQERAARWGKGKALGLSMGALTDAADEAEADRLEQRIAAQAERTARLQAEYEIKWAAHLKEQEAEAARAAAYRAAYAAAMEEAQMKPCECAGVRNTARNPHSGQGQGQDCSDRGAMEYPKGSMKYSCYVKKGACRGEMDEDGEPLTFTSDTMIDGKNYNFSMAPKQCRNKRKTELLLKDAQEKAQRMAVARDQDPFGLGDGRDGGGGGEHLPLKGGGSLAL